ncbi:PKD/REJ-like domain-containing protein [Plasmodiophora brassicae]
MWPVVATALAIVGVADANICCWYAITCTATTIDTSSVSTVAGTINSTWFSTLSNVGQIQSVRISGSPGVVGLAPGAFDLLTSCTDINLQGNGITMIPTGAFTNMAQLLQLNLNNNKVSQAMIPPGTFSTHLQQLMLSNNDIPYLIAGSFDTMTELVTLQIGGNNRLSAIPVGAFRHLTNLQTLGLGYDSVTSFPEGTFATLTQLRTLTIAGNRLTALNARSTLTRLQSLSLYGNLRITTLNLYVLQNLTSYSPTATTRRRRLTTQRRSTAPCQASFRVSIRGPAVRDPTTPLTLYGSVPNGVDLRQLTTQWSCDALDVSVTSPYILTPSTNTLALTLAPNALAYGRSYQFALWAQYGGTASANGSIALAIPSVPTGGFVNVTWSDAAQVELSTLFDITTSGWHGTRTPFTYMFTYSFLDDPSGTEYPIANANSSTVRTTLPRGDRDRNDALKVIVRAIPDMESVPSAPAWAIVQVHPGPPGTLPRNVMVTKVTASTRAAISSLQMASLVLNAMSDATATSDVRAARSAYLSALMSTCAQPVPVNADDCARLLSTLTARPEQLMANATQPILSFVMDLMQQSMERQQALSLRGLDALANSVSAVITANRLANVTGATLAEHSAVDMIASAQLALVVPCQPALPLATSSFATDVWMVDEMRHATSNHCAGPINRISIPDAFWSVANASGYVGIQATTWSHLPQNVPLPSDAISNVLTLRAYHVGMSDPGSARIPLSIRNLSSPINVTMTPLVPVNGSMRPLCVTFNETRGVWNDAGCTTTANGNGSVTCSCTHLTDFAIIATVVGSGNSPSDQGPGVAVMIDDASHVHRTFLWMYVAAMCATLVLLASTYRHVDKVQARRSLCTLLVLSLVVCGVRTAICAVNIQYAGSALVAVAALSVLPACVMSLLLTFFIVMIWSTGDRIQKLSTSHHRSPLEGFVRPYLFGNLAVAVGVPGLVIGGVFFQTSVTVFGSVPLAVALIDAASLLVGMVCLACSLYFLYCGRALFNILRKAGSTQVRTYTSIGRFICSVCTMFCLALSCQSALWVFSIVDPDAYLAGYTMYYTLFLACEVLSIILVLVFCVRTVGNNIVSERLSVSAKHSSSLDKLAMFGITASAQWQNDDGRREASAPGYLYSGPVPSANTILVEPASIPAGPIQEAKVASSWAEVDLATEEILEMAWQICTSSNGLAVIWNEPHSAGQRVELFVAEALPAEHLVSSVSHRSVRLASRSAPSGTAMSTEPATVRAGPLHEAPSSDLDVDLASEDIFESACRIERTSSNGQSSHESGRSNPRNQVA